MTRISESLGAPAAIVQRSGSVARFWTVDQRIVVAHVVGEATLEAAEKAMAVANAVIATGRRVYLVNDWTEVDKFEAGCRMALVSWALKNFKHIVAGYYIAHLKILRMSLQVARLAFPRGFNLFEDDQAFLSAFADLRAYVQRRNRISPTSR